MLNSLIIFGASGDLTSRKLIPAIFKLFCQGKLPSPFITVGISRTKITSDTWRAKLAETTAKYVSQSDFAKWWDRFAPCLYYFSGDIGESSTFERLRLYLAKLGESTDSPDSTNRVYYLAMSPRLYPEVLAKLGEFGMARESSGNHRSVIIEKPFGTNLKTAYELNRTVHRVFSEKQVYRIDHYLGKETVNNIFALRFANTIFEPLWNRNYIDHIQITANESETVGRRGAFYETAGVLRDMFQNHLLQLLTITAMEPPVRFDAQSVRDEKVKVLRSIRHMSNEYIARNTVFGQYNGYREEPGVASDSNVATFAAVKLFIDNWRWKDVPVFLRSGKAMSCQTTQVVIQFREPPHLIFEQLGKYDTAFASNRLLIQIQPSEGIHLSFLSKVPGTEMQLRNSELSFTFKDRFREVLPEAYQRLLLDAFSGDTSLFARNDEVETAWEIVDPIQAWQQEYGQQQESLPGYEKGSWGPDESNRWMNEQHQTWFDLCPLLHNSSATQERS